MTFKAAADYGPLGCAVHQRCQRKHCHLTAFASLYHFHRAGDDIARGLVNATSKCKENILLTPHDALGHSSSASGIDNVMIVTGARGKIPFRRIRGHCRLIVGNVNAIATRVAVIFNDHCMMQRWQTVDNIYHARQELSGYH